MATWDDVRSVCAEFPELLEERRGWRVRNKPVAWERPLRDVDRRTLGDQAWDGTILAVRTVDYGAREALLADDPAVYFTTPHFDGYPAVLIRLERIEVDDLREVIGEGWLAQAPKRLSRPWLAERDLPS